jgi:hypothetical protein
LRWDKLATEASTVSRSDADSAGGTVEKRLREELAELQVEINEEKSRIVDLCRGESFGLFARKPQI